MNNTIAETILSQMGGLKFLLAFSLKAFILSDVLRLKLPKNESGANYLDVHYDSGVDTYTMHFYSKRKVNGVYTTTDIQRESDVYCDSLINVFKYVTKLAPL